MLTHHAGACSELESVNNINIIIIIITIIISSVTISYYYLLLLLLLLLLFIIIITHHAGACSHGLHVLLTRLGACSCQNDTTAQHCSCHCLLVIISVKGFQQQWQRRVHDVLHLPAHFTCTHICSFRLCAVYTSSCFRERVQQDLNTSAAFRSVLSALAHASERGKSRICT